MPLFRILLASMLMVALCCSCGSDDDAPDVPLEDVAISFADSAYWIHRRPPIGLWSGDVNAMQALDYLDFANSVVIMNVQRYLTPSQWNAELAEEPVDGKPGVKYRGYTWFVYNVGAYACQVSHQGGRYVFEGFTGNGGVWTQAVYAEEQTDRSRGSMKVYREGTTELITDGAWERRNDHFYLILKYPTAKYHELHLDIDEKTGAGSVNHWQDEQHHYDVTWDARGAGSWMRYNTDGSVEATGNWEVEE